MKKTYRGSCHCGAITFEADIDLDKGTNKCNCTICWKQRMWISGELEPDDFRLLSGKEKLADYSKSGDWGEVHHQFCSAYGIATHGYGQLEATGGNPFFSVQLSSLDDLKVNDLVAAPIIYMDGFHDNWQNPPSETRHL